MWASPTTQSVFGIDPNDLIGMQGAALVHPDDRADAIEAFRDIGGRGESSRFEFRVFGPEGDVRWVEEVATNLLDEAGVGVIACNLRDITERRSARELADRFSAIVESSNDAILSKTLDGVITTFNAGAERLFGYSAEEVIGRHISILSPPDRADEVDRLHERVRNGERIHNFITRRRASDGRVLHVLLSVSPILDESAEVVGIASIAQDLTDAVRLQRGIESERARLADAQQVAHLGSFEADLATGEISRSDELCRILGLDGTDHTTRLIDHVHEDDRAEVLNGVDEVIAGATKALVTHRIVRPSGEVRWVETRLTPMQQEGTSRFSGAVLDITESHEAKRELVHQATHDRLTGLLNREAMHDRLHEMVTDAPDSGNVAVALLDMDRFKVINDSFGQGFGDRVIQAVAERLRQTLDPAHVLARVGGDEFMIAMAGVEGLTAGFTVAERSRELLAEPFIVDAHRIVLSASAGVAVSRSGSTAESLTIDADTAKFHAKEYGRACTRTYDSDARERAARRLVVESALHGALENGELHLEYQPVVNLGDGKVEGFEALARTDPSGTRTGGTRRVHSDRRAVGTDASHR